MRNRTIALDINTLAAEVPLGTPFVELMSKGRAVVKDRVWSLATLLEDSVYCLKDAVARRLGVRGRAGSNGFGGCWWAGWDAGIWTARARAAWSAFWVTYNRSLGLVRGCNSHNHGRRHYVG
jgi:hypothetical protein